MKASNPLLVLALAAAIAAPLTLSARTWTKAGTDQTIEAEFVKLVGDEIVVKMPNGQQRNLPLAMLSEEDKTFAREQAAKMAEPPAGEGKDDAPPAATEPGKAILTGLHICCSGCKNRIEELGEGEEDDDVKISIKGDAVHVKGDSDREAQAAVDRIMNGGFFGKSNSETVVVYTPESGGGKHDELEVSGVHLCCGKCVNAVEDALEEVPNIDDIDIKKGEKKFVITGKKVDAAKIGAALNGVGLSGKARKPRDDEKKD
jgi:copper chaperone CopZ